MAKNYTFGEAVNIIANGTDLESIADIGRRFPVLTTKIAVIAAKAGDDFVDLMGYMPDYLTANKVNSAIKAGIAESGAEDASDEETENEDDADGDQVEWNESMSAKELWGILGKAGKKNLAKSTKKADLIEACKKAFGAGTEDAEDDQEDDEPVNPYEGKTAPELFKECKARKLKAAAKKPAKYYVDLLLKDDAEQEKAASDEGDDDWDDEAEEPAKDKKAAKTAKGGKAKAAKKEEAEDEDDDWDI